MVCSQARVIFKTAASLYNKALYTQIKNYEAGEKYINWVKMIDKLKEDKNFILLGEKIST